MSSAARSRGVSLIEALVALAVMAFGLLGVVGMQATLRFNADVSRQRAEAVRMAQEKMENLRAFGVLSGAAVPSDQEYIDIVAGTDYPAPPSGFANTAFTRATAVINPTVDNPKMKSVQVAVSWLDRRTAAGGQAETVTLTSNIAEVAPELMASIGLPGDRSATQLPRGRNAAIPVGAGPGPTSDTSNFAPPGATGVSWIFLNSSGRITSVCSAPGVCVAAQGFLVSGYIQFIAPATPPTPALGENPNGLATSFPTIGMQVALTLPIAPAVPPACYVSSATQGLAYFCFVPADLATGVWSGRTELTPVTLFAATGSDFSATLHKVCRYTPSPASHTPAGGNPAHPLDYTAVRSSLTNQNFLMFTSGDGISSAYTCPGDGPSPLIDTATFRHQPSVP